MNIKIFLFGLIGIFSSNLAVSQNINLTYELESGIGNLNLLQTVTLDSNNNPVFRDRYKEDDYVNYYIPGFRLGVNAQGLSISDVPINILVGVQRTTTSFGYTNEIAENQFIEHFYIADLGLGTSFSVYKKFEAQFNLLGIYTFSRDGKFIDNKTGRTQNYSNEDYEQFPYRKMLGSAEAGIFYTGLGKIIRPGIKFRTSLINLNPKNLETGGYTRGYLGHVNLVLQLGDFR
ncbi:MAG: hypothetical protein ACI9WO_000354 [Sphingobacteriales bacterium]|jgi:hypothetical protein